MPDLSPFSVPVSSTAPPLLSLAVAPAQVLRGSRALDHAGRAIARLGQRPLIVGGDRALAAATPRLLAILQPAKLSFALSAYGNQCSEANLSALQSAVADHQADLVIGVGGGKALDTAKLLAERCQIPIATLPTSGATCAAWTALSNVYSDSGAFQYDVGLTTCPQLLILDYALIQTAPPRTLVAGIGDAIAKWYEASVSSGNSDQSLIVAAVQQARVLRDLLFQKSPAALQALGGPCWREVVDASVLLAGAIGGLGGVQCRTVAAHAVHNGLTQLPESHLSLHGEKVAYGILVQLRLEEMLQGNRLAASARQQLIQFYGAVGLPTSLAELGMGPVTLQALQKAAEFACQPSSDLHHLPFSVVPEQLLAAMVSTLAPLETGEPQSRWLSTTETEAVALSQAAETDKALQSHKELA